MHIVIAASECAPYARSGGLADVVRALAQESAKLGHRVTVYIPLYRQVQPHIKKRKEAIRSITVPFGYYNRFVAIVDGGQRDGVQVYFVDCPELFDLEYLYATPSGDYPNNWERFGLFCRAVLEAAKQLGVPDVFHVHDWQAAMLAVYLRTAYYFDPVLRNAGTVLTIHNAAYQGSFPRSTIERLLLPWDIFTSDKVEYYGNVNFLKGGIVYSDAITAVSRKYAEEIQTEEFGSGLESVLRKRAGDLHGILSGVDYEDWDPATDHNIAAHYAPDNLAGKAVCRRDLLHAFGAENVSAETPVVGISSRFSTQKGFDFIAKMAEEMAAENLLIVALGTGEPYYEALFRELQTRYPAKFLVRIQYDEALAHKVEAGSDIYLMPSRCEPCGPEQIYSLKYGTVPVVRATGGLDDSVEEFNAQSNTGTGFKFYGHSAEEFMAALRRALALFPDKVSWQSMMHNGMEKDYSWKKPAAEYVRIYEDVARRRS